MIRTEGRFMSAGLNYYDNRNKVESTLLQTLYTTEIVGRLGGVSWGTPSVRYTRYRTKNYSFVGMSKATARQCVNAKIAQYTRTFYSWYQKGGVWVQDRTRDGQYKELVAGVHASKRDGELWDVEIQVNEVAVVYLFGESMDIEQTFRAYLGDWNYVED